MISTAGFTLTSESLYLGKPIMVVPNNGIFEQTLNALFLERDRLGAASYGGRLTADGVTRFLENRESYARHIRGRSGSGNRDAIKCIERVLRAAGATVHPVVKPQKPSILAETLRPVFQGDLVAETLHPVGDG